jgi:uncharacterized protein involved in exopolysaccharide biosynthesis
MKQELKFYFSIFWRRAHLFLLVALLISAAAIAAAVLAPTKFVADALLVMEAPVINIEDNPNAQSSSVEQLEIIEKRLLTRANLLEISDKIGVFENRDELFVDEIVQQMEERTNFTISAGRDRATLFTVQFEADNPRVAAAVTSSYVTRILAENASYRTERAGDTFEFFEDQVTQLSEELDKQSAIILEFKNSNIEALPDSLEYRLTRQSDLQERITDINREIADIGDQRKSLIEVYNATRGANLDDNRTEEQRQLADLEKELSEALAIYSDQNPRVKILQSRISALEQIIDGQLAEMGLPTGDARQSSVLELELSSLQRKVNGLEQQRENAQAELQDIDRTLKLTPSNGITLEALERDYENLQIQYDAAVVSLSEAKLEKRRQDLSKGERISVLREPVVPREPSSPNRPLIAAGGVALGSAAGVALIALLELLNRSIRRPADLTNALGIVPLATLPFVRTQQEVVFRRSVIAFFLALIAVGVPLGLYLVHVYIVPLDLFFDKILSRVGLS